MKPSTRLMNNPQIEDEYESYNDVWLTSGASFWSGPEILYSTAAAVVVFGI